MTPRETPFWSLGGALRLAVLGFAACLPWFAPAARAADDAPTLAKPSAQPPGVVAGWLARYTNIAPATVVSVGDEYIVAVLSSRPIDAAKPRLLRLEIRAEMTDPDSRIANLVRSLSATLEINCTDNTSHFVEVRTFAAPNLAGTEQVYHPAEGWVADPRGSYFEDVHTAVCTPNAPRPLLAVQTGSPHAASPAQSLSAPLRAALSPDAPTPRAASVAVHPGVLGAGQAQIAAGTSQAKAEAALSELRGALPALMSGRPTRIERVERNGTAFYRALVTGLSPPSDAAWFCRQLAAAGRACIPR